MTLEEAIKNKIHMDVGEQITQYKNIFFHQLQLTWYEFKKLIYYDSPKSYKKKLFFSSQPIVLSTFLSGDMNTSITRLWKAGGKNLKDPLTITITPRIKLELKQVFLMNSLSIFINPTNFHFHEIKKNRGKNSHLFRYFQNVHTKKM